MVFGYRNVVRSLASRLQIGGAESREKIAEGVAAVAELPLLIAWKLGHREAESRQQKEWIVTETVLATRCCENVTFYFSLRAQQDFSIASQRQSADEASCARC